jgi:broad-specificity NMP kinase
MKLTDWINFMRKIIAVSGVPGSGKTSLFRKFLQDKTWVVSEPKKTLHVMYCKEYDLYVLGKYEEGELFAGTDRLSMSVQPVAQEFIKETKSNIIFEGDRLTNFKFYDFLLSLPESEVEFLVLSCNKELLNERRVSRGSNQSETFLKGRETKINNILSNLDYREYLKFVPNENESDQLTILDLINKKL